MKLLQACPTHLRDCAFVNKWSKIMSSWYRIVNKHTKSLVTRPYNIPLLRWELITI